MIERDGLHDWIWLACSWSVTGFVGRELHCLLSRNAPLHSGESSQTASLNHISLYRSNSRRDSARCAASPAPKAVTRSKVGRPRKLGDSTVTADVYFCGRRLRSLIRVPCAQAINLDPPPPWTGVYLSGNPIPISTPSFWDTLKLMFFFTDGLTVPQQQGRPLAPQKQNREEH